MLGRTNGDSTLTCITTLLGKPFGSFDEVWGDDVVCRLVHVILAQVRPDASLLSFLVDRC